MNFSAIMTRAALGACVGLVLWMPLNASATTTYGAPTAFNRPGFTETVPWDISDSGVIVGQSDGVGFIYSAGVFSSFSHPDAAAGTSLTGIANDGTLVGIYGVGNPDEGKFQSFIYSAGSLSAFSAAGSSSTNIRHISSDGRYLTGYAEDVSGTVNAFAFDRSSQKLIDLHVAGDLFSFAQGANILGQVTGSFIRGGGVRGAFIVDLNTMSRTEYLTVDGLSYPRFRDINDSGVVTGFASGQAFVGRPGDWTVLSGVAENTIAAYGINNHGTLVGYSEDNTTFIRSGWLAAPVPEPATWALMALGLAGLALRKRSLASISA